MPANIGTQTLYVKFFDPVDSVVANGIAKNVRKTGIYSGGYLTYVDDVSITLSALECEIGDGTYQIRALTATSVPLTVSTTLKYIVLRWTYTGSASSDYLDFQAVTLVNILDNDLIVGVCVFSGTTLTGFDYTLRSTPDVSDLFLKAEPTVAASMYARIRAGRVSYGSVNYDIIDQLSPLFVAPSSNSWVVLVQVGTTGAVALSYGAAAVSPTAPDYGGLVTLAEVTIAAGATTISASNIKDVRSFIASGNSLVGNVVLLTGDQTVAGVKTFTSFPVTPSSAPTTNYQVANKAYVDGVNPGLNRAVVWYVDDALSTGTLKSAKIRVPFNGVISRIDAYVDTAPTGASIICDINKNGVSVWAVTQANRITINVGAGSGSQTSFDTTEVVSGDYFTLDIDQVGSSTAGSDLSLALVIRETA